MARTASLSGFPEFLPQERLVELHCLDLLRETFELHGFCSIETRALETLEDLLTKGDIDKEVYAVSRLHAQAGSSTARLALHYDLTVPLARYVRENAGYLTFPFRRYQIQKAWRGERPQEGRAREFTQADIDVIGEGYLPIRFDAELVLTAAQALGRLPIPPFTLRLSNRKLAEGFYHSIGIVEPMVVLQCVDKIEKIGPDGVRNLLTNQLGLSPECVEGALALARIRCQSSSLEAQVRSLGATGPLFEQGLSELTEVLSTLEQFAPGLAQADLSIARGLDYYTGTVVETTFRDHPGLGSICSGGRYDSLARSGKRTFPGVGVSIGLSRILAFLVSSDQVRASRQVPTAVYVALSAETDWPRAQKVADALRSRGIPTEVAGSAEKFGKQIKYADRRGIPFVWFVDGENDEVKDLRSGEQVIADPAVWFPPQEDLRVSVKAQSETTLH